MRSFSTNDGRITCEFNDLQELTSRNAQYFDRNRDTMKKLEMESKNIKRITYELSLSVKNYSSLLNEVASISNYAPVNARPMSELFGKMSDAFTKISEKIWQSTLNINDYCHGTIKFMLGQGTCLKTIYKEKDVAYQEVENLKKKIAALLAKDKSVGKDLTSKSAAAKERAGVFNYFCREQTDKLFQYCGRMLFEEFGEFVVKISANTTGILTALAMLQDSLEISKSALKQ